MLTTRDNATRPNRVHLRCGSYVRFPRLRPDRLPDQAARCSTWRTGNLVNSFQCMRSVRLDLTQRILTDTSWESLKICWRLLDQWFANRRFHHRCGAKSRLHQQHRSESSRAVPGLCTIMVNERSAVAMIPEQRAPFFPDVRWC